MIRNKTLYDDLGNKVYPNTLAECIKMDDSKRLPDIIGNTNISTIGDGTITGAIVATDSINLFEMCS